MTGFLSNPGNLTSRFGPTHPSHTWSNHEYAFAYWASDYRKYEDATNHHVYVGEHLTNCWDHGGRLLWTRIGGKKVYACAPVEWLALVAVILVLAGAWLLAVQCSRWRDTGLPAV